MKKEESRLHKAWNESVFLSAFRRFFDAFYHVLLHIFAPVRKIYPKAVRQSEARRRRLAAQEESESRGRFAHMVYGSPVFSFFRFLKDRLLSTTCQSYGMLLVTYGIVTSLYYLLQVFVSVLPIRYDMADFALALVISIFALFLIFLPLPFHRAVRESRLFSWLIFELLGISRLHHRNTTSGIPIGRAFLYGLLFGILAVFSSPGLVLLSLFALVLLFTVMESPEFSLSLTVVLLPFTEFFTYGTSLLFVILALGSVSFFFKLLFRKRHLSTDPTDLWIVFGMITLLFGGIFSFGGRASLLSGLLYASFLLAYFLASNLLSSERALFRITRLTVLTAVPVSLYGILEYFAGHTVNDWLDRTVFPEIPGRIVSTFSNANILSVYLLLAAGLALALIPLSKRAGGRFLALFSFAAIATALVFTYSRGAWLGLLLGFLLFLFLFSKRAPVLLPVFGAALPLAVYLLPETILRRFASSLVPIFRIGTPDSSATYRISVYRGVLSALGEHFMGGIGVGGSAFSAVYPGYAIAGAEEAVHSHSVFLQLFLETGVAGLVFLLGVAVLLFLSVLSHRVGRRNSTARILHVGVFMSLASVLITGLSDHVFYSPRIFLLFFLLLGVSVACGRIGREKEALGEPEDAGHLYAKVDVPIRK